MHIIVNYLEKQYLFIYFILFFTVILHCVFEFLQDLLNVLSMSPLLYKNTMRKK